MIFVDTGAWYAVVDRTDANHARRLGIATAFAFDQHFRQFGAVVVIP